MKLALQGVSVLYASGDSGVANRYNAGYPDSCLNADELYVDNNGTRYSPSFPANCPYITAGKSFPDFCMAEKRKERFADKTLLCPSWRHYSHRQRH